MTLELTLMSVSGLGMIALLVHKHLEHTRGIATRVEEARQKVDPFFHRLHDIVTAVVSRITIHNTIIFLNKAFVVVVRFFMNASHRVHSASAKIVEKASKKTEDLSKGGAASFYLKQIKDAKDGEENASEPSQEAPSQESHEDTSF